MPRPARSGCSVTSTGMAGRPSSASRGGGISWSSRCRAARRAGPRRWMWCGSGRPMTPPVTAVQLRAVVGRLRAGGHWHPGDPPILVVLDAGYDVHRLAFLLADLAIQLIGRIRADRVLL